MDFNIPELVRFNIPFFAVLLAAVVAGGLSFLLYKKTSPPVSDKIRLFLGALRFLLIFALILLLFKPKIEYWLKKPFSPSTVVFVDNSQSMQYKGHSENRRILLQDAVHNLHRIFKPDNNTDWFYFNSGIVNFSKDSIDISSLATDFNVLFDHVENNDYQRVIILSDGNHTLGSYPLLGRQFPDQEIYTIGIGHSTVQKDIAIRDVIYPVIAYQNKSQTISVELSFSGIEEKQTRTLKLFSGRTQIAQKVLTIYPGDSHTNINFKFIPRKIGLNRYKVELESLPVERNPDNNSYVFVQEVLKRQVNIALFAGNLSYESKFINLLLSANPDFKISNFIRRTSAKFYNNANIAKADSADIFILIDFPNSQTLSTVTESFRRAYEKANPSLLIIHNGNNNQNILRRIEPNLPFSDKIAGVRRSSASSSFLRNNSANSYLTDIFEHEAANKLFWSQLPPLEFKRVATPVENADVIISAKVRNENRPVFFVKENPKQRIAVLCGDGFWKWHFYLQNDEIFSDGYYRFLSNIIRWLSDKRRIKPFKISADKKVAYSGEQLRLKGKLLDADYKPVTNGRVEFTVSWNNQIFKIESAADSLGNYTASFIPPGDGSYNVSGRGYKNEILIGEDNINLEIIPYNPEFTQTAMNENFLKQVAALGQGVYLNYTNLDSLDVLLDLKRSFVHEKSELELWFLTTFLILLIAFISIEWYFRKHYGLV